MKQAVLAFITMLALPAFVESQSTLSFPRAIQPSELSTSGFAVVNPAAADAAVIFTLYRADGAIESATTRTIPAHGQLAKLGSDLFPAAANAGWVEATSPTLGLQGFWMAGDWATFMDGADAASSSPELVVSIVTSQTELHMANTGTNPVVAQVRVYGEDGLQLAPPVIQVIPPKGFFKSDVSTLFPFLNLAIATHLKLTCVNPFAALVIVHNFIAGPSWAVVNAVPSSQPFTNLSFPQVVDGTVGGANWTSVMGLTNLSTSAANDLTLTFTAQDGVTTRSVMLSLSPNGAIRSNARILFDLPPGFQSGWVKVTGSLPISGFVAYADTVAAGVAVTAGQSEGQTNLLFAHIADLSPWWTGLALLNPNVRSANVEIFALNPDGSLIGGARFELKGSTKVARLLSEWTPQTQTRTTDGGYIFIRSDAPIYGTEVFFSRSLLILANVAAGKIAPGITYVPPPLP
ncbi:MAG TPA: hypothetical protein VE422_44565 [Terriglobia bacterium]|nr:hypothetical protein [Terriglobia bacterium]